VSDLVTLAKLLVRPTDPQAAVAFGRDSATGDERVMRRAAWCADVADLSSRLRSAGLGANARIALYDEDPYAFSVGLFAAWQVGSLAVLPPNVQLGSLERLRDAVEAAIGGEGRWLPGVVGFAPLASDSSASSEALVDVSRDLPAIELFTSGTTGDGKASPKRLRHLEDEVRVLEATFGAELGRSHQHLYGLLFRVLWPLAAGRAFCRERLLHARELLPRLQAEDRSVLASVPAHLDRLVSSSGAAGLVLTRCTLFSSGGPLLAKTAHAWERASGDAPIEVFGSTETGGVGHRRQRAALGEQVAWTPFAGVELTLERSDSRLRVCSPALSENEQPGFAMGDRATLLADGRFELGGRVDRVVKIGEKRLDLSEMESRLLLHEAVERAALAAIDQGGQARIGAVVVPSESGARTLASLGRVALGRMLADQLARDFDRVLLPRAWRYVDALPEDAQGKVNVGALRALFEPEADERPRAPVWSGRSRGDGWAECWGRVPEDLASLEGHFPGAPIVPGTVQLDWAVELARELTGDGLAPARVEALKFARPLAPGDELGIRVEQRGAGESVSFRLFEPASAEDEEEREIASGRLILVAARSLAKRRS